MTMAVVLALTACTTSRPRAPIARPVAKSPANAPAAATSGLVVLDPGDYERDKNRIKQSLAKNSRDSLSPSDVGYYMDVLQGRLKQSIGKAGSVDRQGDRLTIDLSSSASFESGDTRVSSSFRDVLSPLSNVLVEYRMTLVSVRVRGDDSRAQANHPRSTDQRAMAVARQLLDGGIAGKRIVLAADGADRPRVALQIEPIVRAAGNGH
jgi:outer membrane protein OmpA-like peptidoglycan-associated protein